MSLRRINRLHHVFYVTIHRASPFIRVVDAVAAKVGEDARTAILRGDVLLGKQAARCWQRS